VNPNASKSFTPDITPLILASHKDNYEIIKILLDRGDSIQEPHDVRCSCNECIKSRSEDSLRYSKSRINAYRALASPSLISLSSKDPILTAFHLSWELKRLSRIENEFKVDYEKLSLQCQEYASALLAETRSSHELEIILNYDHENPPALFENEQEKVSLRRLKLAIKYKQKKVNFFINFFLGRDLNCFFFFL
jgi:transient receptor potential cation channel subfamily C member 4